MHTRHFRFNPQQQTFAVQLEMSGKCQADSGTVGIKQGQALTKAQT